jgi:hypothetical protein
MAVNYWWRPPNWKDAVSTEKKMQDNLVVNVIAPSTRADIKSEL